MVDDAEQHSRMHGARGIVGLVQRRLVREPHPKAARARRRGGGGGGGGEKAETVLRGLGGAIIFSARALRPHLR
jgi:hypothetical protein